MSMTSSDLPDAVRELLPLSPNDFHLLLVLAECELYGYGIKKAMEEASRGILKPEIGSLYRMIGRLMNSGLVAEAQERKTREDGPSPGHPRRYYRITDLGRQVLKADASRVQEVIETARAKDLLGS
jgi:DNA-binding PadR family transcriptional regulator